MRVYKFYSARWAYEALDRKRLKVTTLSDINDPFEFGALASSNAEERRILRGTREKLMKGKGLISFSRSWVSPLLWSHYADSHRGISLGFDVPDDLVIEIEYPSERPRLKTFLGGDGELDPAVGDSLYRVKASEWAYENEVRLMMALGTADRVSGLYFHNFDKQLKLVEVILGANYVGQEKDAWQAELEKGGVSFTTARMAFKSFRMVPQKDPKSRKSL